MKCQKTEWLPRDMGILPMRSAWHGKDARVTCNVFAFISVNLCSSVAILSFRDRRAIVRLHVFRRRNTLSPRLEMEHE